jgi:hydroxyacylglutathione hydrolase
VVPEGARIALHASSLDDAERAARGLRAVGVLEVDGWFPEAAATARLEPVELDELEQMLAANGVQVVDVREKDERDDAYIAGSRHVPYRVVRAFADDLREGGPVVTICQTGSRASIAASVLAAEGVQARPVIHGGVPDWEGRGGETVAFRRCGS